MEIILRIKYSSSPTSEVYHTDTAAGYGFVKNREINDEARTSRCSTYAYAMGTYRYNADAYNTDAEYTKYNGNIWWWLRSPGDDSCECGRSVLWIWLGQEVWLMSMSTGVLYDGVRPALHLNLSSSNFYSYAGTVCSDAMKTGESGTDNPVNPGEPERDQIPQTSLPSPINQERPQEPEQRRAMLILRLTVV